MSVIPTIFYTVSFKLGGTQHIKLRPANEAYHIVVVYIYQRKTMIISNQLLS